MMRAYTCMMIFAAFAQLAVQMIQPIPITL